MKWIVQVVKQDSFDEIDYDKYSFDSKEEAVRFKNTYKGKGSPEIFLSNRY